MSEKFFPLLQDDETALVVGFVNFSYSHIPSGSRFARRLANFWEAIRINIPEAFIDPRKCLIQKVHGIFAFNFFIAPAILQKYKDKDFVKALSGLKQPGAAFWKRSNKDGASKFGTGMGGYSNLASHIKKYL